MYMYIWYNVAGVQKYINTSEKVLVYDTYILYKMQRSLYSALSLR
jgi:hypothetical protein